MRRTTLNLIKEDKELNEIYKKYKKRVRDIEKNLTNRTPSNLELYCRWLRVSGKKGDNVIYCRDAEAVSDLERCVECYGIVYDNVTLAKLEEDQIKSEKYLKRKPKEELEGKYKSFYNDMRRHNQIRIEKYMKKSMLDFIKKTDKLVK